MPLYLLVTEIPGPFKVLSDPPFEIILSKSSLSIEFIGKPRALCFVFTGVVKRIIPAVASTNAVIAGMLKELISLLLY